MPITNTANRTALSHVDYTAPLPSPPLPSVLRTVPPIIPDLFLMPKLSPTELPITLKELKPSKKKSKPTDPLKLPSPYMPIS